MNEYPDDEGIWDYLQQKEDADLEAQYTEDDDVETSAAPIVGISDPIPIAPGWHPVYSDDIFCSPFEKPKTLCEALEICAGRPIGIIGAPGAGKNDASQALALAIASGKPAFGIFPVTTGKVLHLTWDMGDVSTRIRYRRLANGMGLQEADIRDRIVLCPFPLVDLTNEFAKREFAAVMRGFDLAIIDNARAAAPGAPENDSTFGALISLLGEAAQHAGCIPLYLHHGRKGGGAGLEAIRGSTSIAGASGAMWLVEGQGSGSRKVTQIRMGDCSTGEKPPFWLRHEISESPPAFDTGPELAPIRLAASLEDPDAGEVAGDSAELSEAILVALTAAPGMSGAEIAKALGRRKNEILAEVQNMIERGELTRVGKGPRQILVPSK